MVFWFCSVVLLSLLMVSSETKTCDPNTSVCSADAPSGKVSSQTMDSGEPALHPSHSIGGGCPMMPLDGTGAADSRWSRVVDVSALTQGAGVYVCHSGEDARILETDTMFDKPRFAKGVVLLVENFLTKSEIREMRSRAEEWGKDAPDEDGWRFAYGVGRQYEGHFDLDAAKEQHRASFEAFQDRFVNRVESRIAAFLRIRRTPLESYMQLTQEVPNPSRRALFHHDKNHAMVRHATALIYLTGSSNNETTDYIEGGETLFPTLPRPKAQSMVASKRSTKQQHRARQLNGLTTQVMKGLQPHDAWPELHVPENHPYFQELGSLCRNASQMPTEDEDEDLPLAVAPTAGRALFFWHESAQANGGELLPDVWHAGCPVRIGRKMAIQKFKNFGPEDEACKSLRWCVEGWNRTLSAAMAMQ